MSLGIIFDSGEVNARIKQFVLDCCSNKDSNISAKKVILKCKELLYKLLECNKNEVADVLMDVEMYLAVADSLTYKDHESKIKVEVAGTDGKKRDKCSFCGKVFENEEDGIDTCTHTECVRLCEKCYRKAGNSVR